MTIRKKKIIFIIFILFLFNIVIIIQKNRLEKAIETVNFDIEVLEWQNKKIDREISVEQLEIEKMRQEWQDLLLQRDFLKSNSLKIKQDIDTMIEETRKIEKR